MFFWIPAIVFAEIDYVAAVGRNAALGHDTLKERQKLRVVGAYYQRGFQIIFAALKPHVEAPSVQEGIHTVSSWAFWNEFTGLLMPLTRRVMSASVVWIAALAVIYYVHGSIDFLTAIPQAIERAISWW
jgi:hypothetical protein